MTCKMNEVVEDVVKLLEDKPSKDVQDFVEGLKAFGVQKEAASKIVSPKVPTVKEVATPEIVERAVQQEDLKGTTMQTRDLKEFLQGAKEELKVVQKLEARFRLVDIDNGNLYPSDEAIAAETDLDEAVEALQEKIERYIRDVASEYLDEETTAEVISYTEGQLLVEALRTLESNTKEIEDVKNSTLDLFGYSKEDLEPSKDSPAEEMEQFKLPSVQLLNLLNASKPMFGGENIRIEKMTDLANGTKEMKYTVEGKGKILTTYVGVTSVIETGSGVSLTSDGIHSLKSDAGFVLDTNAYDEMAVNIVNNPKKMLELAEELSSMGPELSATNKTNLMSALGNIVDPLKDALPKLNLFINQEAAKTGGVVNFNGDMADVYISIGSEGSKSALEVFVHEVYHAATKFAVDSNDPELRKYVSRIVKIRKEFFDKTTEADLVEAGMSQENAVGALEYFSDKDVGLHEFIAYSMTNPVVQKVLRGLESKETKDTYPNLVSELVGTVRELINKFLGYITKAPKGDDLQKMVWLVSRIAEANKNGLESKRSFVLSGILGVITPLEDGIKAFTRKYTDKARKASLPRLKSKSKVDSTVYLAKLAARAFVDDKAKKILNTHLSLSGVDMFKAENTVMTMLRDMAESDSTQDDAETISLLSQQIDQQRELIDSNIINIINVGFNEPISEESDKALSTVVLDTDLGEVFYDYDFAELVGSEKALNVAIKELKEKLGGQVESKDYNYFTAQAEELSSFMVTGKGSLAVVMNAHSITHKVGTEDVRDNVSDEITQSVDKLVSLLALKKTSKEDKRKVAELYERDAEGVENVVAYQMQQKKDSEEKLFVLPSDKIKMIKGYSKDIYTGSIEGTTAPLEDEAKMKRIGYKLKYELKTHELDKGGKALGYYVSSSQIKQNLHRVGMRYTDKGRKGTGIRETRAISGTSYLSKEVEISIQKLEAKRRLAIAAMEAGTYKSNTEDSKLIPIYDNVGKVRDFRYVMGKDQKKSLFKLDNRASRKLGRTFASTMDKSASEGFNNELMKLIKSDSEKNYIVGSRIGKNGHAYVLISKDSDEQEIKDLWNVLPSDVKRKHPGGFAVRRDLTHTYLGYREFSVFDSELGKKLPGMAVHWGRIAGQIWKEVVKVAKVDVIIRTPAVILGNVTSNFMYSLMTGESPLAIAKLQMQGVKDIDAYVKGVQAMVTLEYKKAAGKTNAEQDRTLSRLKNELKNNPVADLVDAGFYTTIVEELDLGGSSDNGSMFSDILDDKLKNYPGFIRNGIDLLYLNENTKVFKVINKATQYSDFVARYAQYHLMVKKGTDKDVAIKTVRDAFINYNKPNSRFVEWVNQMGFVMFTKYFTRIQKAIKHLGQEHPLKLVMALLGQEMVLGDIEDISDQSILTKDLGNVFYSPLDNIFRAITPTSAEAVIGVMN